MQTMVPLYGFGGGGGTGAALTVTAPAGCTVTVSKDGKTKTKVAGTDGVAVFKGLATGQWTVTISDGSQTAQKTVTITADYSTAIAFFSATIHVTYPAGSTCTATDGVTTLTAPDTSGTWDCVVPNAGTWVIECNGAEWYSVDVTENGQSFKMSNLFCLGDECTDVTGGWEAKGILHRPDIPLAAKVPTVTKNDSSVTLSIGYGNTYHCGIYKTKSKVNLSGYSKIIAKLSGVDLSAFESSIGLMLISEIGTYANSNVISATVIKNGATEAVVEVPEGTGDCYIVFYLLSGHGTIFATIEKVRCES